MLHKFFEEGYWFEPKRYGYGAGLPIAWQGWALIAAHLLLILGLVFWALSGDWMTEAIALCLGVFGTIGVSLIARRRTRGEWRWRWSEED